MKNTIHKRIAMLLLGVPLMLTFSCTEPIDIELDSTYTRCVIYGQITTDTTAHRVSISTTSDYFSNTPPRYISNALVRISDEENEYLLTEDENMPGTYYTEPTVYGVPGRVYTLYADNVDLLGDGNLMSYTASCEMRPVATPDSIKAIYRPQWQGWIIQAYAQDPPESKDFYMFLVYINGVLHTDSLHKINYTDDTFLNGSYTNGVSIYFIGETDSLQVADTITAAFCGITEDYYNFVLEVQTASGISIPLFSGPPANPRTNLSNDAIGYFTAYSMSKVSTIIEEP